MEKFMVNHCFKLREIMKHYTLFSKEYIYIKKDNDENKKIKNVGLIEKNQEF